MGGGAWLDGRRYAGPESLLPCRRFVLVLLFMNLPAPSQPSAPSSSAPTASRNVVWWSRVLSGFLLGLFALLVALSYYNFTLYCENFGCMGKGLLWMLWAVFATMGWLVALGGARGSAAVAWAPVPAGWRSGCCR